jgi:hypothetical protein
MTLRSRSQLATFAVTAAVACVPGAAGAAAASAGSSGDGHGVSAQGSGDASMSLGALLALVGSVLVDAMNKTTAN